MLTLPPLQEDFIATYVYKDVQRTCNVGVRYTSDGPFLIVGNSTKSWNLRKDEDGKWYVASPRKMDPELLKAIGAGIDAYLVRAFQEKK